MKRILVFIFIYVFLCIQSNAQDIPVYRHFYFNPSVYNPAYNGFNDFTEINLTYRKQWVSVEDAPETIAINLQLPTNKRLFFGLDIYSEEAVLLRNTVAVLDIGYALPLSTNQELRFSIASGIGWNSINVDQLDLQTADPTILQAYRDSYYLDGRFGLVYRLKSLEIGFSLPQLFKSNPFSDIQFNEVEFSQLEKRIYSIRYAQDIGTTIALHPQVLYIENGSIGEWAGALGVNYKKSFWLGASYRNSFGVFAGVKFENILIQYNYEMSNFQETTFDKASHGIQLSFLVGQKKSTSKSRKNKELVSDEGEGNLNEENQEEETVQKEEVVEEPIEKPVRKVEMEPADVIPVITPVDSAITNNEEVVVDKQVAEEDFSYEDKPLMKKGFYVVVGVFKKINNAQKRSHYSVNMGYKTDVLFNPENNFYYVVIYYSPINKSQAIVILNQVRQEPGFIKSWLMEIN